MKTSFQLLAMMILAVILGVSTTGCDSHENTAQSTIPLIQDVSDSELEKAAEADIAIAEIEYQLYLDGKAAGPTAYDAVYKLWVEARKKKMATLKSIGIDFQTYKGIMGLVRLNEDVGKRFQEKVQKIKSTRQQEMR